ncbi:MAG TPA: HlyD family efflux transporter periplasmic adaptor subunit [Rhizomicrobium sp.]|jgi:membrane fusion protein (multidrug efflux system)|nr:HlyD family efflux transporter periplasmic adaptor subunit [Rhizomicrobium sp.]
MTDIAISGPEITSFLGDKQVVAANHSAQRKQLRKRLFAGLGIVLLAGAVGGGGWYYEVAQHSVSTDDAYVDADSAQITPQINATVLDVPVTDTVRVKRGHVLLRLDASDAELAFAQAEANYGQALRHVRQYFANSGEAAAQISARESDVTRTKLDYDRRLALAQQNAISAEQLSTARNAFETAQADLTAARETLASRQALIHGSDVEHNPEVLSAKAALDTAKLNLSRTVIRAPFDGVVAQKTAEIGQRVQVGQVLMSVVPVNRVYVDANFKEGQLNRVRTGQPVTLTSDLYGSTVTFHGRVMGLSGGTGSAFAVIPAQNATGNWIKVVQRLPVRVALDPDELAMHPLRVGLSMTASIDLTK